MARLHDARATQERVIAGVSAIIIINIATADSDSSDGRALLMPMGDGRRDAPDQGGAVLLRF